MDQINVLEHKEEKAIQSVQQEEKRIQKNKNSVKSLWNNFKHYNIHIIGVPKGEEKEQELRNLFEYIIKENSRNLVKEIDIEVQEAQRTSNKMDAKKKTSRHIIIKMQKVKVKERILNSEREKQRVTYKGIPITLLADFSKETLQARRNWQEVLKMMKSKDLQPKFLYPAKLSFRIKGQIK